MTPFELACGLGNSKIIELLLEKGANPNGHERHFKRFNYVRARRFILKQLENKSTTGNDLDEVLKSANKINLEMKEDLDKRELEYDDRKKLEHLTNIVLAELLFKHIGSFFLYGDSYFHNVSRDFYFISSLTDLNKETKNHFVNRVLINAADMVYSLADTGDCSILTRLLMEFDPNCSGKRIHDRILSSEKINVPLAKNIILLMQEKDFALVEKYRSTENQENYDQNIHGATFPKLYFNKVKESLLHHIIEGLNDSAITYH